MNDVVESISIRGLSVSEKRKVLKRMLIEKRIPANEGGNEQAIPLSKGQEALWYIQHSAPDCSAYNVAGAIRVYAKVSNALLERAINFCVQRHPMLKARYLVKNGFVEQYRDSKAPIRVKTIDARGMASEDVDAHIRNDYHQPFDLRCPPLLRFYAYQVDEEEVVLMLVVHHIVFDAHSLWILMDELGACYEALTRGEPVTLQARTQDFASYVRQQKSVQDSDQARASRAYWLKTLHCDYRPLDLDIARPRPKLQRYKGGSVHYQLPGELTLLLKQYAKEKAVTVNAVLMSAFYCLLYRHSGEEDIFVMSPTSGRLDPRFARTIGYFVNPIVVRANLSSEQTFGDLLQQVQRSLLEGLHHQETPFTSIVEQLNPTRDSSYTPFSQFSFVFQQPRDDVSLSQAWAPGKEGPRVRWAGLDVAQYSVNQQEGQFELEIEAVETSDSIVGSFKYNDDIFTEDSIQSMVGHYITLLSSVLEEKSTISGEERPISMLDMLMEVEKKTFEQWNRTNFEFPGELVLHRRIEQQVDQTPNNVAITFESQQLSYKQLNAKANQLANYLIENGVKLESKVAVFMDRSLDMVISLLAVMKAGGVYVPIDPHYPTKRIAFLIEDATASMLLSQPDLLPLIPDESYSVAVTVDTLELDSYCDKNVVLPVEQSHLAYMIYTSGSTGEPKGAMNTHAGICNRLLWMQKTYQLTPRDVVLQKTPFSFDVSVWEFFWPLLVGAKLCIAKPEGHKDTQYLIDTICIEGVTTLHFVPSMLSLFLADNRASQCASIRRVICSGEALSYQLQTQFFTTLDCELHNLYGPTEAAIDVSYWQCQRDSLYSFVPIGRPINNIQLHILDRHMQPVPVGVHGELHIGGIGVARGYHQREALTEEKFVLNPFSKTEQSKLYKTGDLCRYLPDGNIDYLGRIDNQVKLRGFRIELGEVESALRRTTGVRDAIVLKQDKSVDDGYLVAYVTVETDTFNPEDAIRTAKDLLPEHCIPKAIVVLKTMPLTPNGKIDIKQLPKHTYDRDNSHDLASPRSEAERQLVELWRKLLKLNAVSIHDNFFDLGGHSLLAVKMMADIEAKFCKRLPLSSLIENPTITALASLLECSIDHEWDNLVRIQTQGDRTPMFFIPGGGGNVLYYYALSDHLGKNQPFYAIQAKGLDGITPPNENLSAWVQSAVSAILKDNPTGPYIIGGHCVGGLIAHEVAQTLIREGKTVEKLIILDAPAPHFFPPKVIRLRYAQWIVLLLEAISHMTGKVANATVDELDALSDQAKLDCLKEKLVSLDVVTPTMPISQIQGLLSVFIANAQLHYDPAASRKPLPIALIRAKEASEQYDYQKYDDAQSSLGWKSYANGQVNAISSAGDHITMLSPIHAEELATCVKSILL